MADVVAPVGEGIAVLRWLQGWPRCPVCGEWMVAYWLQNGDRPTLWVCADGWERSSIHWDASSAAIRDHSVHWSAAKGIWECWHHMDEGRHCRYEKLDAEAPSLIPWDAPAEAVVKETGGWKVVAKALVPLAVNDDCELSHRP